jgi:hemolysin III
MSKDLLHPENSFNSIAEEIANSVTHGIGVGLSIAGVALLVAVAAQGGDPWRIVSVSIFGTTLVLLYLASTLYHSVQEPTLKRTLRRLDHVGIYLLIAGSYTPFLLVSLRGPWGWTLFGIVWGLATIGITFKMVFMDRFRYVAVGAYLLMGWLIVIAIGPLFAALTAGGIFWLVMGGLSYSIGVIFYAWEKLPYNHAIWHLFVMGGSICHFFSVFWHVVPVA